MYCMSSVFLITREAAWHIISVVSVCLYISFSLIRYISLSRKYGSWSSSIWRSSGQLGSRKGHRSKNVKNAFVFPQCKTSIGDNSTSTTHRAVKFACTMGFSAMVRIEWCNRHLRQVTRKWPRETKCTHSRVVGLILEVGSVVIQNIRDHQTDNSIVPLSFISLHFWDTMCRPTSYPSINFGNRFLWLSAQCYAKFFVIFPDHRTHRPKCRQTNGRSLALTRWPSCRAVPVHTAGRALASDRANVRRSTHTRRPTGDTSRQLQTHAYTHCTCWDASRSNTSDVHDRT